MLSQISPAVSPLTAPREQFAIIPLSTVRALSGTCTRSAVLTYCALAAHADQDGHCWPGRARLGDIAGLSERQVSRATAELERKNLLRKETLASGRVDYYLTPISPLPKATAPPDTAVTPPLTPLSPLTDQGTDHQGTEREQEPEPPTAEPEQRDNALSSCRLQTKTALGDDWQIPDDWREWAEQQRPDLTSKLDEIADNFSDYHSSRGTRSACWLAEWRRWVRRERAPRKPTDGLQAPQASDRRYPTPEQEKAPLPKAVQTAVAESNRKFREQCLQMGIDPDTGRRLAA
jgi:hypothetical protein